MIGTRSRLLAAVALVLLGACSTDRREDLVGPEWILVGVDGGERRVLERMWERGELPNLRRLADRGVFVDLGTRYGASPVIWTTIATGVAPERHGIRDFVVATEAGDVPVTSAARRAPALWNMLGRAGRRVAVIGWWATWPAEDVPGLLVSDRLGSRLPDRIRPRSRQSELDHVLETSRTEGRDFGGNEASTLHDRIVTRFATLSARERIDLLLAYYRSVDLASHDSWRAFEPEAFGDPVSDPDGEDPVSRAYRAFDSALGDIVSAARPDANIVVLSDHGFHATRTEQVQLLLDLDRVLEFLGLLHRDGPALDTETSFAFTYRSPSYRTRKMVRFTPVGEELGERQVAERIRNLARALAGVRFGGGGPAFLVRPPIPREIKRGAQAIVEVLSAAATASLIDEEGREIEGAVRHLGTITGSHGEGTSGIFLAAGPEIDAGAGLDGLSIHDIAPTLLAALGLPVAEDFSGEPRLELLTPAARASRPLRTIATWGARDPKADVPTSPEDRELLEELAGLGYLR